MSAAAFGSRDASNEFVRREILTNFTTYISRLRLSMYRSRQICAISCKHDGASLARCRTKKRPCRNDRDEI